MDHFHLTRLVWNQGYRQLGRTVKPVNYGFPDCFFFLTNQALTRCSFTSPSVQLVLHTNLNRSNFNIEDNVHSMKENHHFETLTGLTPFYL